MDLIKLLNGSNPMEEENLENESQNEEKEGQWRDRLYKRKGINFSSSSTENRTLRSMQVSVV